MDINETRIVNYRDVTGLNRDIQVQVRTPTRPGVLPVVIWAHGGESGIKYSATAFTTWSEWTVRQGYIVATPAFRPRRRLEQAALCAYQGVTNRDDCDKVNSPSWDRPFDIKAIIDELSAWNAAGSLRGRIDLDRIIVGGHSAGSTATLTVAGAAREFAERRYPGSFFMDTRPLAFIALSPASPGSSGLFETSFKDQNTSWDDIHRPVLWATGSGDSYEQFPHGRAIGFGFLPPGGKYKLFVDSVLFGHGSYGDEIDTCGSLRSPAACTAFQAAMRSIVFAFLDAYLERRAVALQYLQGGYAAQIVPGNVASWTMK